MIVQSCRNKCAKLEVELKEANKKLKDVTNQMHLLENSSKKLSAALKVNGGSRATVGGRHRKAWSDCSSQYQRKKRWQIARDVQTALSFTENEDFTPTRVELMNKDTGEVLSVEQDGRTRVGRGTESETSTENLVDKTLYIKERFNVSNQTYHELAMVNKGLPRTSPLTKRAKELDANYTVHPTPAL